VTEIKNVKKRFIHERTTILQLRGTACKNHVAGNTYRTVAYAEYMINTRVFNCIKICGSLTEHKPFTEIDKTTTMKHNKIYVCRRNYIRL